MVATAFILVGTEVLALWACSGRKRGRMFIYAAPKPDALASPGASRPICFLFSLSRG